MGVLPRKSYQGQEGTPHRGQIWNDKRCKRKVSHSYNKGQRNGRCLEDADVSLAPLKVSGTRRLGAENGGIRLITPVFTEYLSGATHCSKSRRCSSSCASHSVRGPQAYYDQDPHLRDEEQRQRPPGLYARRPQLGNGRTRIHTRQATPEPLLEATGLVGCLIIKG